ncbi:hypothetical protein [Bartonella sp. AD13SXNS]
MYGLAAHILLIKCTIRVEDMIKNDRKYRYLVVGGAGWLPCAGY